MQDEQKLFPFEVHATVPNGTVAELHSFATKHKLKALMLDLQTVGGESVCFDTMITKRFEASSLFKAVHETVLLRRLMQDNGFDVKRVKLESPLTFMPFVTKRRSMYLEAHVKVTLYKRDTSMVRVIAQQFKGHLSRNALKITVDSETKYITIRSDVLLPNVFSVRLMRLTKALEEVAITVNSVESELVLFDNGRARDTAWIEA